MKKKFINGLLLIALFVGFTSSMVSCKDYDDEKIGNLEGIIASNDAKLRDLIDEQVKALNKTIADLQELLDQCRQNCAQFQKDINDKLNLYLTIENFNTFMDEYSTKYYTKEEVDANFYKKEDIDNKFNKYYTKEEIDSIKKALEDELMALINQKANADAIVTIITDAINGDEGMKTTLENFFTNNEVVKNYILGLIPEGITEAQVKALIAEEIKEITKEITKVNAEIDLVKEQVKAAQQLAETNKENLAKLDAKVEQYKTELDGTIQKLATDLQTTNTNLLALTTRVETLETTATSLQNQIDEINKQIVTINENVAAAQNTANEALAQAQANSASIAALEENYKALEEKLDSEVLTLRTMIDDAASEIETLKQRVEQDELAAIAMHNQILETISGLANTVNENTENLGQLRDAFASYKNEMAEEIATLKDGIYTNTQLIFAVFNYFYNAIAKNITGVAINGTNNPMFGELALPLGIRSNVLVAFHGELNDNGIMFPADRARFYVDANQAEVINEEDLAMLGVESVQDLNGYIRLEGNQNIVAGQQADGSVTEGNAGTLYLTVNPTDRDFTGTQFSIINSQNEESMVTLSDLVKSDHVLTWGYTRGAGPAEQSENGFYETKATFSLDAVNSYVERLNVNLGDIKDVVNDIRDGGNFSAATLLNAIHNNVSRILEAKAVKATWEDDLGMHSFVSQYDLAVTTIKPLSFGFAQDVEYTKVANLDKIQEFLDNILKVMFKGFPNLHTDRLVIENISLDELTNTFDATFTIKLGERFLEGNGPTTVSFDMPTLIFTDDQGVKHEIHVQGYSPNATFTVSEDGLNVRLFFNIKNILKTLGKYTDEPVENIKAQINEILGDVEKFIHEIGKISADNIQASVSNGIMDYIENFVNQHKRWFKPNNYMRPVLLVKANTSYSRISTSPLYPSKVKGNSLLLTPTSFNGEILAPAFKKFVAVTNVTKGDVSAKGGDAACKSVLDQMNSQDRMAQVIDGDMENFLRLQFQAGYTYEVLYTAVDYSGFVFAQKYYLTVVE